MIEEISPRRLLINTSWQEDSEIIYCNMGGRKIHTAPIPSNGQGQENDFSKEINFKKIST